MKREIKFRAWDSAYKSMHEVEGILFSENEIWIENNELNKSSCELMQYTGLKDKSGKEIYESDIIKVLSTGQIKEVIYHKCAFSIKVTDEIIAPIYWHDDIEVIGNIHENKDLL